MNYEKTTCILHGPPTVYAWTLAAQTQRYKIYAEKTSVFVAQNAQKNGPPGSAVRAYTAGRY